MAVPDAEPTGGYGPLEAPARNKVKVITAWPDMLRVACSLVTTRSAPTACICHGKKRGQAQVLQSSETE
jgi:hypothetical protein